MSFPELHKKNIELINNELGVFLNKEIKDLSDKEPFIKLGYEMIKDYTLAGGKRLRPFAMIMSYLAMKKKEDKKILLPAIAVELHQSYSLILDDIMDEDELRRGHPGINKKLKEYFLVNFRDASYNGLLFSRKSSKFITSFALMLGNITGILSKKALLASEFRDEIKAKALSIIEKTDEQIYHGQMKDMLMENRQSYTEEEYLEMTRLKTGVFFGMAFELGGLFAEADEDKRRILREFGICSAIAFQLQDDIIDIIGEKGHELGSDIKKGKKTLLMIKTFEKTDNSQYRIMKNIYGKQDATESEIGKVISIMHDTGAIDYCKKLSVYYNNEAKDILRRLKLDLYYSLLFSDIADFMIKRNY